MTILACPPFFESEGDNEPGGHVSFFNELKRRNLFRVAIAYLAAAWLLTEVAGTLFPMFGLGDAGKSADRDQGGPVQR